MIRLLRTILPFIGKGKFLRYIFWGILSGLFSFLFVNFVTRVVALIMAGRFESVRREYMLIFAAIILLFIWIRRTLSIAIITLSQNLFWGLRKEILSFVLRANYQQLKGKRTGVQTAILTDVSILMDASLSVIQFATSVILAVSCLIYLLIISKILFFITFVVALLGIAVYQVRAGRNLRQFQRSRTLENIFQQHFISILDGFKEIFMDPKKGISIYENNIAEIANESYRSNMYAFTGFVNNQITGQALFYGLISAVLLLSSFTLKIKPEDTVSFVFTLLYLLGSIETIMVLLPILARARVATGHLMDLRKELGDANFNNSPPEKYIFRDEFETLTISGLQFQFGDGDKAFRIGPIDLSIRKGEIVFIYGGNGSGKTTFLYSILGLYPICTGEIRLNDIEIKGEDYAYYRTLFAVVFSDFYLFNEIRGLEVVQEDKWNQLLQLFELQDKVKLNGKQLSTTELSAGQRKRLALIVALLEEKPILVIDEWAADQDPYFRRKFYTEIIPWLKSEGVTIIAVTHDDKYYPCADRLYKMDYGKLTEEVIDIHEKVGTY